MPAAGPQRRVLPVPGNHSLRGAGAVRAAVGEWLDATLL
jgi:hypothetical protein